MAVLGFATAALAGDPAPPLLRNGGFEEWTATGPAGWELSEGATTGTTGQASEVAADAEHVREGKSALRLSGSAGTTSWRLVRQRVAVKPGDRITLTASAKSVNVRQEGTQYPNAHAMLELVDAKGARVQLLWTPPMAGTRDWTPLRITALVPDGVAAALPGFFLSQSGTLWIDDARASVAPATLADSAGRAAAFDAVEAHLRATYPFFGHGRKPAAEALLAKWRPVAAAAGDDGAWFRALRSMLAELDDPHVWMKRAGKLVPTATSTALRVNLDRSVRRAALTEVLDEKAPFLCGRIGAGADAVGYLAIDSWVMDEAAAARLDADLGLLADCRALVLDVRANQGGDETLAQRVASRFAAADVVYARSVHRDPLDPAEDAFLPPADRTLAARKGAKPDLRPVAVLQGHVCMSSCEGFLLMARALPTVTTVGDRSRGASANPRPFAVTPDLTLWSSTWRTLRPGGEEIEGVGVPPEVEETAVPSGGKDPVLARALECLRR